jgi:hypothetical protein
MRDDAAHGIPRRDSGNFLNQKKGGGRGNGGQAPFPREQAQGQGSGIFPSHEYIFSDRFHFALMPFWLVRNSMEIDFITHCHGVIFIKLTSSSSSSSK